MPNAETLAEHKAGVDESKAALGFKVQVRQDGIEEKGVKVVVRWLKGTDSVLYESFCGMLKRKLEGRKINAKFINKSQLYSQFT